MIDGLGASAAYMTAIAADHVIARESAITGSIGVIFQYGHFEDLLQKIGVEYEEMKSAPLKGEPSLFHEPDSGGRGDAEIGRSTTPTTGSSGLSPSAATLPMARRAALPTAASTAAARRFA